MNLKDLAKPFPPETIEFRVGKTSGDRKKGMALAYIDARSVQDRLDLVCGIENWQNRYTHVGEKTVCEIGIRISGEWVWKADGAGDTDFEAEKGAMSDAFKRAAVKWGVGRYLYDLPTMWVELVDGKYISDAGLQRLKQSVGATTTKVTELNGLSKQPAAFWSGKILRVSLINSLISASEQDQLDYFYDKLEAGVLKAPSLEHLERFHEDNKHIYPRFDELRQEKLAETFQIRREQWKTK